MVSLYFSFIVVAYCLSSTLLIFYLKAKWSSLESATFIVQVTPCLSSIKQMRKYLKPVHCVRSNLVLTFDLDPSLI